MSPSKKLFSAAFLAILPFYVSCVEYILLLNSSSSPMKCEDNNWIHHKPNGELFDIERHSEADDPDAPLKIIKEKNDLGNEVYSLSIKLHQEAPFQYYLGTWTCKDNTYIVKGPPFIRRLAILDDKENHRDSYTVNEGEAVKFECEAFVVSEGAKPEFSWSITPEVEGAKETGNASRWRQIDSPGAGHDDVWKSSYELIDPNGVTKDDRFRYTCKVRVADKMEGQLRGSRAMLLRVKGRYAALWPAIGIVIEVLILGLGTLLYEKRKKAKTEEAADSQPNDADTAVAPSSSSSEVRKRTNVNT